MDNIVDVAIDALGLGTQDELAERVGRAKQEVSRWRKQNRISPPALLEILRQLIEDRLPDGSRRKIPLILFYADISAHERPAAAERVYL